MQLFFQQIFNGIMLGRTPGVILEGYILGFLEAIGGGYFSAAYKDVYAFGALILILSIRPRWVKAGFTPPSSHIVQKG